MADIYISESNNICKASASVAAAAGSPLAAGVNDFQFRTDTTHVAVAPSSWTVTVTGSTSYSVYVTPDPDVFSTAQWVEVENSPFTDDAVVGDTVPVYGIRVENNDESNAAVVRIVGRL